MAPTSKVTLAPQAIYSLYHEGLIDIHMVRALMAKWRGLYAHLTDAELFGEPETYESALYAVD